MADELRALEHDLRDAADEVTDGAYGVVKKAAVNVKRDWRRNARHSSGTHARAYPFSITFDISQPGLDHVTAVVGPDHAKKQGELGVILEFGSPTSPPHNDGGRAMREEEPRFEKALRALAEDAL